MPEPAAVEAALAGHRGDADTARRHLSDTAAAVRAVALRALSRSGDLTADELAAAVDDRDPLVRIAALELAANRDDLDAAIAAARLDDSDEGAAEAAAWACGEIVSRARGGPAAAATVAALAKVAACHHDPLCRESAIAALGTVGDPKGLRAVLGGLNDKPAVRRRAVIALAPFEGPEVDDALASALLDRHRQVREVAAELDRMRQQANSGW